MPAPSFDVAVAHRYFAIECNNQAWDWLETGDRTPEKTDAAIHTAVASLFHWSQVGTPLNVLRARYLLANVYAMAGQSENACRAVTCCEELLAAGAEDWDRAFVLDARSRATHAAGDHATAEKQREAAQQSGAAIADAECRQAFVNWFSQWSS